MTSDQKTSGYQITNDPGFQYEKFGNTPELIARFEDLYLAANNKEDTKVIEQLTDLILKHPESPQLKNFLFISYYTQGNHKKASEINSRILTEHPDYLFAKLNLANEYIDAKEPEKVPEVLGEEMEIKGLYPERDLFHLAEVTGFYKVAVRYFVAIGKMDLAEKRLKILQDIAPDHPDTEASEMLVNNPVARKFRERWEKEQETSISVEIAKPHPGSKRKNPPKFTHPEIDNLYLFGPDIPWDMLEEILALDRETVIADLEKVLKDADRYLFFRGPEGKKELHDFVFHAICLLAELKSEKSLPLVLDFLENDEEVLDFWIGDHLTETMWMPVFIMGQNNIEVLKQFLLKPGVYTYSKSAVSVALSQIALHQPQRRDEIKQIFSEVFTVFLEADINDNLIDSSFLSLAIAEAIDSGFSDLLPVIKKLYDKGYVSLAIHGDYEEVEEHFRDPLQRAGLREIESIFELYENVLTTWATFTEDPDFGDSVDYEDIPQPAVSNKIGRNDPCPCGSGKKYKKCCMNKE